VRGLFVTGTDTGVGKSIVAAAICAALTARGEHVAALKPAVTGLDEPAGTWPPDHDLLAAAAGGRRSPAEVAPYRFGPAVSPHLASAWAGTAVQPSRLRAAAATAAHAVDALVVEGVGGLLVPLTDEYLVRDLAVDLGLPVVVAARPGLGTINHTLLTVEAARAAGLAVAGIVMTPWPGRPTALAASNRETVEALSRVSVTGLPPTAPEALAEAGAALPLEDWLAPAGATRRPRSGHPERTPQARTRTARRGAAAATASLATGPPVPAP
jgi:dethiobiotin synthetase